MSDEKRERRSLEAARKIREFAEAGGDSYKLVSLYVDEVLLVLDRHDRLETENAELRAKVEQLTAREFESVMIDEAMTRDMECAWAKDQLAELRKKIKALWPWMRDAMWEYGDAEGLQESAFHAGWIVCYPYDPETHGPAIDTPDPGDDWYMPAPWLAEVLGDD